MDGVEITDVSDGDQRDQVKKAPLQNQDLSSVSVNVGELLAQYGWCLLVVTVLVYLLIQHLNKKKSSRSSSSPPTQQDAALVARNQDAMETAWRKMQEELDAKAAAFREKQKQQEEEKRRQKIEMWECVQQGKSYKGTAKLSQTTEEASTSTTVLKPKTERKPLRSADYNPLTGQGGGGSCAWRPGRRGPSSGG